jgi:hypothetical protein
MCACIYAERDWLGFQLSAKSDIRVPWGPPRLRFLQQPTGARNEWDVRGSVCY